jgi:hypothetical protein
MSNRKNALQCLRPLVRRLENAILDKGLNLVTVLIFCLAGNFSLCIVCFSTAVIVPAIVLLCFCVAFLIFFVALSRCRTEKQLTTLAEVFVIVCLVLLTFMSM